MLLKVLLTRPQITKTIRITGYKSYAIFTGYSNTSPKGLTGLFF